LFLLFNDKKKARPAGHDQLAGTTKKSSADTPNNKGQGQGHVPYESTAHGFFKTRYSSFALNVIKLQKKTHPKEKEHPPHALYHKTL